MVGLALLACSACTTPPREAVVGRYVVPATGETWTLRDDGSCTIERGGFARPCEWEYRKDDRGTRVVVTVSDAAAGGAPHTHRYVLTPGKWAGQPVTLPLSSEDTLEKQEDPDIGPTPSR